MKRSEPARTPKATAAKGSRSGLPRLPHASTAPTEPPWRSVKWPRDYVVTEGGVWRTDTDGQVVQQITLRPAWVDAIARDGKSTSWSLRLRWFTLDDTAAERIIPLGALAARQSVLISELSDAGLVIVHEQEFRRLLTMWVDVEGLPRLRGMDKLGFASVHLRSGNPSLCFVLPAETIYCVDPAEVAERVILLPKAKVPAHRAYYPSGDLASWRAMVEPTRQSPLQTFAICAALAGPLLSWSGVENGGFHLYGVTSRGKTLALQLACTVWGNGTAPNMDASVPTLLNQWSSTVNALERVAAAHSDTVLALDEIGSHTGEGVSIYRLLSGRSKGRLNAASEPLDDHTWNVMLLSSGEIPMQMHVETSGNRRAKGGELIRLLDVPIDTLVTRGDAAAADELKRACGQHFGTAGPEFVRRVMEVYGGDAEAMRQDVGKGVGNLRDDLCREVLERGETVLEHHERAMLRLALVGIAGWWAAGDLLPHTEDEVIAAVRAVRDAWLGSQSFVSEEDRAIEAVRNYAQRYRGQMLVVGQDGAPGSMPPDCHGILDGNRLILTDNNFREACDGLDTQLVVDALKRADILHRNDGQKKAHYSNAKLGISKARHYILKWKELLAGAEGDDEAPGDSVAPPEA